MLPSNRKQKGKNYEQKVSDILHTFFYSNYPEYKSLYDNLGNDTLKPQRDKSSGNYSNSDGDIELNILKKFFPFSIECKHHATLTLSLHSLLSEKITALVKIYKQQEKFAADRNLLPLVVFRANRTDDFIFIKHDLVKHDTNVNHVIVGEYIIMKLDCFLKIYNVDNFCVSF